MSSVDLLYPAIVVFALLVTGLILTVIEFSQAEKSRGDQDSDSRNKSK